MFVQPLFKFKKMEILKKLFGKKIDFKKLIEQGAKIIDVRTAAEFSAGHVPGAVNISLEQLNGVLGDLKKKNVAVITCCQSGIRSGVANNLFRRSGIESYNGGGWQSLLKKIKE